MAKIYWKVSGTTLYLRNNSASGYSAWTELGNSYPAWATDTNRNTIVTINIQNAITPDVFFRWFNSFEKLTTITNWNNLKLTNIASMSVCFSGCTAFNQLITIPNSITDMSYCFRGCTNFNQPITIPDSVTDMKYCFDRCTSFNQPITIPNSVIDMRYCFCDCTSFNQSIVIPNSVIYMRYCFAGCSSFNQPIIIPNSVTDMHACFGGCSSLEYIVTLNNPTDVGSIFYDTTQNINITVISDSLNSAEYNTWSSVVENYNNVYFTSDITTYDLNFTIGDYEYTNFNEYVIGEDTTPYIKIQVKNTQQTTYGPITAPYINNVLYDLSMSRCFYNCTSFNQSIVIPNSVTDMSGCFRECFNFNQPITIPNSVTNMYGCFEHCASFNQSITIPNGVTNISYCFWYCTSFNQSIEIPNSVTNMYYCFYSCRSLNQPITIPNSVIDMYGCFRGCTNFNQPITIPNGVTNISYCFHSCTSLNNIITINSLTLLAETSHYDYCFYGTTQKIILCCDYRVDSTMKSTLNAIAATADNMNVQVGELSITVIANRDNINTTDANVQVTITRFRGNNEVINAIDIYKDDSSTPETVTWSPSDMRMDTAVKTFTTTISNINEAKTVQLKVIARDDFSDSAPQYATVATNFYTIDVLAGGKEISFGMKAVQDDLYESIQDETVPTFETNKFYERVVNSETGYNSYILLETEPDDWGTNWNDYYILAHEDGLFKCAMDAQFNNNVSVGGDVYLNATPLANFVIEEGTDTNGYWYYRKWSNGTAECWLHHNVGSLNLTKANYRCYLNYTYQNSPPVSFASIYNLQGNASSGTSSLRWEGLGYDLENQKMKGFLMSDTNSTASSGTTQYTNVNLYGYVFGTVTE